MTDITTTQYGRHLSSAEIRANALAEIQTLHSDYEVLRRHSADQTRMIERLTDRNNLLLDQLRISQQNERVVTRKLIRLATAMSNIGMLSKEAEAIVQSTREWTEDETEQEVHTTQDQETEAASVLADNISRLTPTWSA